MADDPAQKTDKPSEEEAKGAGKGATEAKATTSKAKAAEKAEATEQKPPKKAAASRKPKTPKAEATAAAETGVGKEEAEAADGDRPQAKTPAAQKKTPASRTRARDRAEARTSGADAPAERVLVHANAKYVRTSARKARLVCDHIRGKTVDEAFAILAHTPRHVAEDWRKLLQSAVANAEHNHELLGDDLRIAAVKADEGPTLKRFRPRAMGRATKIRKRTSHLTISLTPKD